MEQITNYVKALAEQKAAADQRIKELEAQLQKIEEDKKQTTQEQEQSQQMNQITKQIINSVNQLDHDYALKVLQTNIEKFSNEQLVKIWQSTCGQKIRETILETRYTPDLWFAICQTKHDLARLYIHLTKMSHDELINLLSDERMDVTAPYLPIYGGAFADPVFIDKLVTLDNENCREIITRLREKLTPNQKVTAMKNGIIFDNSHFDMELVKEFIVQKTDIELIRKNLASRAGNIHLTNQDYMVLLVHHYPKLHETAKSIGLLSAMAIWRMMKNQFSGTDKVADFIKKINDAINIIRFMAWAGIQPWVVGGIIFKEEENKIETILSDKPADDKPAN